MLDALRHDPPGTRFQRVHDRLKDQHPVRRGLLATAGALVLLVGVALLVLPGPGIPLVIAGLALLTSLSSRLARLLDRAEIAVRRRVARYRYRHRHQQ